MEKLYNVYDDKELMMTISIDRYDHKLRSIEIHSDRYTTDKGAKIGYTFDQARDKGNVNGHE